MAHVQATFSVWSSALKPDEISQILAFVPDHAVLKGADRIPPRGSPLAYGWHINCCDTDEVLIENTVIKLLDRISPLLSNIKMLHQKDSKISLRFVVIVTPYSKELSLYFSEETINRISNFNASIDIIFEFAD